LIFKLRSNIRGFSNKRSDSLIFQTYGLIFVDFSNLRSNNRGSFKPGQLDDQPGWPASQPAGPPMGGRQLAARQAAASLLAAERPPAGGLSPGGRPLREPLKKGTSSLCASNYIVSIVPRVYGGAP